METAISSKRFDAIDIGEDAPSPEEVSYTNAVNAYAEFFVTNELKRHSQEKIDKLLAENPTAIDDFRAGWQQKARDLANDITAISHEFLKRFRQGLLYPSNQASRKLFTAITGLALPSTVSGTEAVVGQYCGGLLEAYDAAIVQPLLLGSEQALWKVVDARVIDGSVNGAAESVSLLGHTVRRLQSGSVRAYATWLVVGVTLVVGVLLW